MSTANDVPAFIDEINRAIADVLEAGALREVEGGYVVAEEV